MELPIFSYPLFCPCFYNLLVNDTFVASVWVDLVVLCCVEVIFIALYLLFRSEIEQLKWKFGYSALKMQNSQPWWTSCREAQFSRVVFVVWMFWLHSINCKRPCHRSALCSRFTICAAEILRSFESALFFSHLLSHSALRSLWF